jgi:hypothetical protein
MDDTCAFPRFECYLVRLKPKPCSWVVERSPTGMMYQLCSQSWLLYPRAVQVLSICSSVLQNTALLYIYRRIVSLLFSAYIYSQIHFFSHPVSISRHLVMIFMLIMYETDVNSVTRRSVTNIAEVFRFVLAKITVFMKWSLSYKMVETTLK